MTLRELFAMATGRRQALRLHAYQQAALVWTAHEVDIEQFMRCGALSERPSMQSRMAPELRAKMDEYIDQIMSTGKLVI